MPIDTNYRPQDPNIHSTQAPAQPKNANKTNAPQKGPTFSDNTNKAEAKESSVKYTEPKHPVLAPPKPGAENISMEELSEALREANEAPLFDKQNQAFIQEKALKDDIKHIDAAELAEILDDSAEHKDLLKNFLKTKKKEVPKHSAKTEGKVTQTKEGKEFLVTAEQHLKQRSPLDNHTRQYIEEEIEALFTNGVISQYSTEFVGMTTEGVKEKLMHSYFHPESMKLESPLHELIKQLKSNVKKTMQVNNPEFAKTHNLKSQKEEITHEAQLNYGNGFMVELTASDASVRDKRAVEYALYNPKARPTLSTAQKELYHTISTKALAETTHTYGVHAAPKVDGERYNVTLDVTYTTAYLDALRTEVKQGTITKDDFDALRARLYYPDSNTVNDSLAVLEKKTKETTLSRIIADNGLPSDWTPTISTVFFDAIADGTYRDEFQRLVGEENFDSAIKAQLLNARGNPESLPANLQTVYTNINTKSIDFTIRLLKLNAKWKVKEVKADPNLEPQIGLIANGAKIMVNDLKKAQAAILAEDLIPASEKSSYMSYLAVIGEALDDMQQLIYLIESSNAKMSKILNSVLLDAQKNKIDKANEEAKAQREASETSKGKGVINVIGKILGPVLAILTVITALAMSLVPPLATMAPLLIGLSVVLITLSISKAAGFDIMTEGFKAIDSMLSSLLPDGALKTIAQVMIKAVIVATVLIACCICGPGGILLALNMGVEALLASNIISDIVAACGGGEMAQMIVTMIVMVVVMVALLAFMFVSIPKAAATVATNAAQGTGAAATTTVSGAATTATTGAATTATGAAAMTGATATSATAATGSAATTAATSATQASLQGANTLTRMITKLKVITDQLKQMITTFFTSDARVLASRLKLIAGVGSTLASASFGIAKGASDMVMYQKLAELATMIARLKGDQTEIDGLIKNLRMLINNLMAELSGMSEMLKTAKELDVKKYTDAGMEHVQC